MVAAAPGAIVDSFTSNRSTAKRTGANGSTGAGGADAVGPDARVVAVALGRGVAGEPLVEGPADDDGGTWGVTT
jgi:hypothetical protein